MQLGRDTEGVVLFLKRDGEVYGSSFYDFKL